MVFWVPKKSEISTKIFMKIQKKQKKHGLHLFLNTFGFIFLKENFLKANKKYFQVRLKVH